MRRCVPPHCAGLKHHGLLAVLVELVLLCASRPRLTTCHVRGRFKASSNGVVSAQPEAQEAMHRRQTRVRRTWRHKRRCFLAARRCEPDSGQPTRSWTLTDKLANNQAASARRRSRLRAQALRQCHDAAAPLILPACD